MKDKITDIKVVKVKEPKNHDIYEVSYTQSGKRYTKEVKKSLDVVKVLLYHRERDAFVLVKQFRALTYINHPELAIRYELCGGREDKEGLSSEEIAKEEVFEETGYRVDSLEKITTLTTGGKMTLFFAEIDESMKVNSGGGLEEENIELVYLPVREAKEFMFDESKPKRPALMFAFCWFLNDRCNTKLKSKDTLLKSR